jgi:hypothetical protein
VPPLFFFSFCPSTFLPWVGQKATLLITRGEESIGKVDNFALQFANLPWREKIYMASQKSNQTGTWE